MADCGAKSVIIVASSRYWSSIGPTNALSGIGRDILTEQASQSGCSCVSRLSFDPEHHGGVWCIASRFLLDIRYAPSMVYAGDGAGNGDTNLRILTKIRYLLDTVSAYF